MTSSTFALTILNVCGGQATVDSFLFLSPYVHERDSSDDVFEIVVLVLNVGGKKTADVSTNTLDQNMSFDQVHCSINCANDHHK